MKNFYEYAPWPYPQISEQAGKVLKHCPEVSYDRFHFGAGLLSVKNFPLRMAEVCIEACKKYNVDMEAGTCISYKQKLIFYSVGQYVNLSLCLFACLFVYFSLYMSFLSLFPLISVFSPFFLSIFNPPPPPLFLLS